MVLHFLHFADTHSFFNFLIQILKVCGNAALSDVGWQFLAITYLKEFPFPFQFY